MIRKDAGRLFVFPLLDKVADGRQLDEGSEGVVDLDCSLSELRAGAVQLVGHGVQHGLWKESKNAILR